MPYLQISNHAAEDFSRQMQGHFTRFISSFGKGFADVLWIVLNIIFIFAMAQLALNIFSRLTRRGMNSDRYHKTELQGKRMDSIMTLLRSTIRYAVYGTALVLSFGAMGIGDAMSSMIVTAGIGSVAIGFGAQSLVKDVVTGFFMMFENQFSVGDLIKVDEHFGFVEATAMRVTYLRTSNGEQVIIPNGTISRVINYTRGSHTAVMAVTVPYELDIKAVMAVMQKALDKYAIYNEDLLVEEPFIRGITKFDTYGVEITASCRALALKQWEVERGMRLAVKEAFDEKGIRFATPTYSQVPYKNPAESFDTDGITPIDAVVGDERHWRMGDDDETKN